MDLVNHGGDHSGNYYDTVDDLLKQAQNDYQAGKLSAREAYERVCKTLREGITDGSIKPYKSKEVSPVP